MGADRLKAIGQQRRLNHLSIENLVADPQDAEEGQPLRLRKGTQFAVARQKGPAAL